jgi:hypothetical protein
MNNFPRIVDLGGVSMLAFLDAANSPRLVNTERLDGVARHRDRPAESVVFVTRDESGDESKRGVAIPSIHPVESFVSLGVSTK